MHLGFTGTRAGMTLRQLEALAYELRRFEPGVLHHGDCKGADAQAAELATGIGWRTEAHPANLEQWRAYTPADVIHEPLPALERNHVIVQASHRVIACPDGPERRRSGTWATIRYAQRAGWPILIILPQQTITSEGWYQ
jgi:hypothetical protein